MPLGLARDGLVLGQALDDAVEGSSPVEKRAIFMGLSLALLGSAARSLFERGATLRDGGVGGAVGGPDVSGKLAGQVGGCRWR